MTPASFRRAGELIAEEQHPHRAQIERRGRQRVAVALCTAAAALSSVIWLGVLLSSLEVLSRHLGVNVTTPGAGVALSVVFVAIVWAKDGYDQRTGRAGRFTSRALHRPGRRRDDVDELEAAKWLDELRATIDKAAGE